MRGAVAVMRGCDYGSGLRVRVMVTVRMLVGVQVEVGVIVMCCRSFTKNK